MILHVRNKYAQEANISIKSFVYSNYSNVLELHFEYLPDNTLKQLMTLIGFRESGWNKGMWEMPSEQVSSISAKSY